MNAFTPKKLYPEEAWGEKLRQARLSRGIKIETAAKHLHIRQEYLVALEEERLDSLPTGLYGKTFLREYTNFLGFSDQKALKDMAADLSAEKTIDPFSQKIIKKRQFMVFPKIVRSGLAILAVLVCLLYLVSYFKNIVSPPALSVTQPEKNLMTDQSSLLIAGETEKEAEVRINGELVLNNHDGLFSQTINLKQGLNNITVTAKKKYGREAAVTRQILVN